MSKQEKKPNIKRYTLSELEKMPSFTDWDRVDRMTDDEIDYSDIPELDDEFFKNAKLIEPQIKQSLTVRYDPEVIDYFRNVVGKGYQSKMNSILKTYVRHQKAKMKKTKS